MILWYKAVFQSWFSCLYLNLWQRDKFHSFFKYMTVFWGLFLLQAAPFISSLIYLFTLSTVLRFQSNKIFSYLKICSYNKPCSCGRESLEKRRKIRVVHGSHHATYIGQFPQCRLTLFYLMSLPPFKNLLSTLLHMTSCLRFLSSSATFNIL